MQRDARNQQIEHLKRNGFKIVKDYPHLYINESGNIYSFKVESFLNPDTKNCIKQESKYLNVAKLVLQAFSGESYRAGQITYIDGNKANFEAKNIKYKSLFERTQKNEVNKADLMKAIRCYFAVNEHYKTKNYLQTRQYLQTIVINRAFFDLKSDLEHIEIFKTFLNGYDNSTKKTAKKHKLSVLNCAFIVNSFINLLINDVLNELESGILTIIDFEPKKLTAKQELREWQTEKRKIMNQPTA